MAVEFTEEQKRAINCTDKTLLLSAAAGSGKTATLTARLISMLTKKDDPLDVSRMLVVTFTRAAAEELRVRIAAAIDEKLAALLESKADEDLTEKEKRAMIEHLERSSLLMPSAKIRTIDSFCNDLVKGHTESLGIKPRYRIPDDAETELLATAVLDEVIFDAYEGRFAPSGLDIATLAECAVEAESERDLCVLLYKLYNDLSGFPDGLDIIKENAEEMPRESALPFFETRWGKVIKEKCIRLLTDYKEGVSRAQDFARDDALFEKNLLPAFLEMETRLGELLVSAKGSYTALKTDLAAPLDSGVKSTSDEKLSPEGFAAKYYRKEVVHETLKKFGEVYLPWEEKDIPEALEKNAALGKSIYLLLSEFDRRFKEEKRARGLCTFNDLEHFAYRLLWDEGGKRTALARELASSFDAICIDEYQDVNDLQHLIFEAISTPKNRFMVGDIKQSIYAFRGAKPDIFASLRSSLPTFEENKDEAVLYLTQNFRSVPSLIDFNNGVFDFLFKRMGKSIDYKSADRLKAGMAEPDPAPPVPEIYYLHTPAHAEYSEWDMVALKIKELLKNGRLARSEKEKKKGKTEKIEPDDIAILYRQGAAKRFLIADALSRHGIPVTAEDTRNFFLAPEILLALCLLHSVNNPRRDIYLTGLLRSPLYAFTMDDLLAIKRQKGAPHRSLYDDLVFYTEVHPDFQKGARVLSDLEEFRGMARNMPADSLCSFLFHKTALYAIASEEGRERLNVLYDCARTFEANSFHGLYRFVSYLGELLESGKTIGKGRLLGDTNGTEIVTMHHSKGLEYPITFIVSSYSNRSGGNDPRFSFHPSLGVSMKVRDKTGLAILQNPVNLAVHARSVDEDREEELRVLYVALTRAVQQMFVTGASISKAETVEKDALIAHLFPSASTLAGECNLIKILAATHGQAALHKRTFLEQLDLAADTDGENESAKEEGREEKESAKEAKARFVQRFAYVYPHSALGALPGKVSVSRLYPTLLDEAISPLDEDASALSEKEEEKLSPRTAPVPFFLSGVEEDAAAKAGTATHLFLQFCDFSALAHGEGSASDRVQAELKRLTDGGFIHPTDAQRVRIDELAAFAESELLSRILAAKKLYREFRFNVMLPASLVTTKDASAFGDLKVLTQGVIDLLIENADGTLSLCDYKTDRLKAEMLKDDERATAFLEEKHASQLFYYAEAIERIFGRRPSRIELFSLHAGKGYEIDPHL